MPTYFFYNNPDACAVRLLYTLCLYICNHNAMVQVRSTLIKPSKIVTDDSLNFFS